MFPVLRLSLKWRVTTAAVLYTSALSAATIQANFIGVENPLSVQRTISGGSGTGYGTSTTSVGIFHFQQTGGTHDLPGDDTHFYGFCVEPFEFVATGVFTFANLEAGNTLFGGMGTVRANRLRELFTRYAPVIHASLLDTETERALQVASWELVRETTGTFNVLSGSIFFGNPSNDAVNNAVRTAVYNRANQMLASLTGNPNDRLNQYYALTRIGNQDIVVWATPEPSSVVLISLGAAAMMIAKRRRRSAARQNK